MSPETMKRMFDLYFAQKKQGPSGIESTLTKRVPARIEYPWGSETILLVNDEELVLKATAEKLTGLGYKVITNISSIEAYRVFRENPYRFDLLITNQAMPKMTGMELASKIHEMNEGLPIIVCNGFSADIKREIIDERGIWALFNKPILRIDLE